MGVATGCGCKDVYIDFLILLMPTPLVSVLFCSSIPTFCSFKKNFSSYLRYGSQKNFRFVFFVKSVFSRTTETERWQHGTVHSTVN